MCEGDSQTNSQQHNEIILQGKKEGQTEASQSDFHSKKKKVSLCKFQNSNSKFCNLAHTSEVILKLDFEKFL